MFVRETIVRGKPYLSVVEKRKQPDGKWKTKYIAGLGYVADLEKVYENPKQFFKDLIRKIQSIDDPDETEDTFPLKSAHSQKNLGYIYIKWILDILDFKDFFDNIQKDLYISYDLYSVFCLLVFSQIISPSSIEEAFLHCCQFFEPFDFELYDIYRALDHIAKHSDELQAFIFKKFKINKDKLINLYFDGSNVWFENDRDDPNEINEAGEIVKSGFRTRGFSKENRPNSIVNFGLLNTEWGLPIAYVVFAGREHEKTYLVPLIYRVRDDYDLTHFQLSADRGNYTGNIIAAIEGADHALGYQAEKYIIGMSVRMASTETKDWILDPNDFRYFLVEVKRDDPGYFKYKYREISRLYDFTDSEGKEDKCRVEQVQLAYYSPKYALKEKIERTKKIEKSNQRIAQTSLYNASLKKGPNAYINEERIIPQTGEVATKKILSIDEEKIKKQESLDGYYLIVTNNNELMPLQIKSYYRKLYITEDDFRILKSDLKLRPVFLRIPEHILAHFIVCIIALQIVRIFGYLLNNVYTIPKIIDALRDFNCYQEDDYNYFIPYSNEIIESLKAISNIGFSKRHVSLKILLEEVNLNNASVVTIGI